MKTMTKIAVVTASLISAGALTACQSTGAPKENYDARMTHADKHGRHMTPEQREQWKKFREQRKQIARQMKTACDGKAIGESVQIQSGDRTIAGSCHVVFQPDHKAMREMRAGFRNHEGRMNYKQRAEAMQDMTDEQRAEMKQQFQQKRTERRAQWQAVQNACSSQSNGKALQVKLGDKLIDGRCVMRFQVQRSADKAPSALLNAPQQNKT
ncbi:hypothetical protein [Acinetobacter sp. WZC-1]|uniref:hypothetical protein n=1 Tax=Acinetobacter sp. WZC-1 TaxID=3459034 RepID=UPI00403DF674